MRICVALDSMYIKNDVVFWRFNFRPLFILIVFWDLLVVQIDQGLKVVNFDHSPWTVSVLDHRIDLDGLGGMLGQ